MLDANDGVGSAFNFNDFCIGVRGTLQCELAALFEIEVFEDRVKKKILCIVCR